MFNSKLTVEQIRAGKKDLETIIQTAVDEFEEKTGMEVDDVKFYREEMQSGRHKLIHVKTEMIFR